MYQLISIGILLFSIQSWAAPESGSKGSSYVGETQNRRAGQRFNILDWINANKKAVSEQNARWGRGGSAGGGPFPDFVFSYMTDVSEPTRDGVKLGKETHSVGRVQFLIDEIFTRGNKTRSLNIDLGFEGFVGQSTKFEPDPTQSIQKHSFSETGGGLLIRPFGRSSQDTGLLLKGGYVTINETNIWFTNDTQVTLGGTYLAAEAKLYLMPFLGGRAEYTSILESQNDQLQGKWKVQSFLYGAFLEIYLLNLGAHLIWREFSFTPQAGGTVVKEESKGVGFSGTLYF